jgi:hypothetical protein
LNPEENALLPTTDVTLPVFKSLTDTTAK